MEKWQVLPTDPRYQQLTDLQLELLFEHWKYRNRKVVYNEAGEEVESDESYHDPDFDAEWDAAIEQNGEDDSNIVGENPSEPEVEGFEEGGPDSVNPDMNFDDADEWEEV